MYCVTEGIFHMLFDSLIFISRFAIHGYWLIFQWYFGTICFFYKYVMYCGIERVFHILSDRLSFSSVLQFIVIG